MLKLQFTQRAVIRSLLGMSAAVLVLAGCANMEVQPKIAEPYAPSNTFTYGARELEPGVVPVGYLREDEHLYNGTVDGELARGFPIEITSEVLAEGQRTFNDFCTPCHGYGGNGDGIIYEEGIQQPATFHTDRLRGIEEGHLYEVITNGIGVMYGYGTRIQPEDRWAVVAYIRALQLSQYMSYDSLPPELQAEVDALDG
ncbi:MAG: cytochrome c [Blastochloris sp.]|nr:cytochrome c [Blastochloris sp.]